MSPVMLDPVLRIALRTALSLLFLWAAAHKLRDVGGFHVALAGYELLPQGAVRVFTAVIVAAEGLIGVGLLGSLGGREAGAGIGRSAAVAATGLLCLYSGAIVINLRRGRRHIACGCAGAAHRQLLSSGLVVRNGVLGTLALMTALPAASRHLTWVDTVTVGAAVTTLALLYTAIDGLVGVAPRSAGLVRDLASRGELSPNSPLNIHHSTLPDRQGEGLPARSHATP